MAVFCLWRFENYSNDHYKVIIIHDDDDDRLYFNRVHNYSQDCCLPYGPMKLNYNISSYKHLNYLLKEQLIHSMYQSKQTDKNGIRRKTGLYVLRASLNVNSEVK